MTRPFEHIDKTIERKYIRTLDKRQGYAISVSANNLYRIGYIGGVSKRRVFIANIILWLMWVNREKP